MLQSLNEGPCQCCGKPVDDCICPECEICHSHGDPDCYRPHTTYNKVRKCTFNSNVHTQRVLPPLTYNKHQLLGQVTSKIYALIDTLQEDIDYVNALRKNQTDDTDKEITQILNNMLKKFK